jgi:hypothetical protein
MSEYGEHLRRVLEGFRLLANKAEYEPCVRCVVMPCCGFTFDADHSDDGSDPPTYTCPLCHPQ